MSALRDSARRRRTARSRKGRRLPLRLTQLYVGLALYGASAALMVRADVGLGPWDVFHQGVARHSGLSIGVVSIIAGAAVLLLWWPLRQRPGLGTVSNVFLVGLSMDATLWLAPAPGSLWLRVPLLVAGVVLNGVATGLYISGRFGPGPRDGLMTGLHQATGRSIRLVRTGIELAVLLCGFLLGGSVGVGTVAYALAIGPLAQIFLRVFAISVGPGTVRAAGGPAGGSDGGPAGDPVGDAAGAPEPVCAIPCATPYGEPEGDEGNEARKP